MHNDTGARFQIVVDGTPRSNGDTKGAALEAAEYLQVARNSKVEVQDSKTGEIAKVTGAPKRSKGWGSTDGGWIT